MIREPMTFEEAAGRLVDVGRRFDGRGWVLGTSGNFSLVLSDEPLRLAMTPSGAFKGELTPGGIVEVDGAGKPVAGRPARPSAEARLHLEIARLRNAGAVLHTHSVCRYLLSDRHAGAQGLAIEGYEMLKGLAGVSTHAHKEWVPILENDQDMERLAAEVAERSTAIPSHTHSCCVATGCTRGAIHCRKRSGTSRSWSFSSKPSGGTITAREQEVLWPSSRFHRNRPC